MTTTHSNTWWTHFRASMVLGLPLIGAQLAQMGINTVDTVMLGWVGTETLAASVLASGFYGIALVSGFGLTSAVTPLVTLRLDSEDNGGIRRSVRMGLWAIVGYSILLNIMLPFSEELFLLIGQDPVISALAEDYLVIMGWSLFPVLFVSTLRAYLSALERVRILLLVTVASVPVNALLNYVLIFGNFGAPELGLEGAAVASVVTNTLAAVAIYFYCQSVTETRSHDLFARFWRIDVEGLVEVIKLGLPISLSILAEIGFFTCGTIMLGWVGTVELAAHGIVFQIISIAFMIPLSFSQVATIRMGRAIGRKDQNVADRAGWMVLWLSLGFAVPSVSLYLFAPDVLIGLYLEDDNPYLNEIITYGSSLMLLAAAFQIFDFAQVSLMGMLRAFKDTRIPMFIALFSYWVVGLPTCYVLGFVFDYGGVGVWSGLAFGLAIVAILLGLRYSRRWDIGKTLLAAT